MYAWRISTEHVRTLKEGAPLVNLQFAVIVTVTAMAFAHICWAAWSRKKFHDQREPAGEVLAYGWGLKGLGIGATLFWLIVFVGPAQGFGSPSLLDPSSLALVVVLAVLVFPIWALSVEVFGAEYHVSAEGIRKHSPWTRNFFARWDDVESLGYNPSLQWTVLRTRSGTIRIQDLIRNKEALVRALESNVPAERLGRKVSRRAVAAGPVESAFLASGAPGVAPGRGSNEERVAYRKLARAGLARRSQVPVLPADYLDRRYIRAFRRVFGPVQPGYFWVGMIFVFFVVLGVALVQSTSGLSVGLVPSVAVAGVSGFALLWADGSFAPVPRDAARRELTAIARRIRLAQWVFLLGLLVSVGSGYALAGAGGFLAAGTGFFFGFAVILLWLFASSRLAMCDYDGGVTVHRRYRGRWTCLRCGATQPGVTVLGSR